MSTLTAVFVGAALLSVFVMLLVRARRIERDVDFTQLTRCKDGEDRLTLLARVVANSIVASP
jgi:hypothetical protein